MGVQTRRSRELIQEGFLEEEVFSSALKKEANEGIAGGGPGQEKLQR